LKPGLQGCGARAAHGTKKFVSRNNKQKIRQEKKPIKNEDK